MKEGLTARIETASFPRPPIFGLIAREGAVSERDMYNTFNMGVGLVLAVPKEEVGLAKDILPRRGAGLCHRVCGRGRRGRGTGMSGKRIAVLVSGGGTNLQALLDAQARGEIRGGEIVAVLSSKEGAYALERAAKAPVASRLLPPPGRAFPTTVP